MMKMAGLFSDILRSSFMQSVSCELKKKSTRKYAHLFPMEMPIICRKHIPNRHNYFVNQEILIMLISEIFLFELKLFTLFLICHINCFDLGVTNESYIDELRV